MLKPLLSSLILCAGTLSPTQFCQASPLGAPSLEEAVIPQNLDALATRKKKAVFEKYALIPYPKSLKETQTGGFPLKQLKGIYCADAALIPHLEEFTQQLRRVSGLRLNLVKDANAKSPLIRLECNNNLPTEGYTLKVTDEGVLIEASRSAGFFYALQTLKQLLPRQYFKDEQNKDVVWQLPYVEIADEPQLAHRGFMLDVARHFFPKEEVMRILDLMALYKMNVFHWHLTDDQGWRIEIPEYPLLTEVGSIRKSSFSNPGEGGKFYDDTEYGRGMWYTQADLKEVVAYAQARHIDIIPEVDFPGHMVAAVTAYPELSCNPSGKYEVRIDAGVSKDVLNIGNDKVIDFLKCIMDNLAGIFPYQYIHFGGDECPTDQWKNNADCLRRVDEKQLKGVEELQSWLIEELGTYVKTKYNKDIMVWDELLEHWNTKNKIQPVVMAWRNIDKTREAANKGLKTITCPHQSLYLDMMQVPKDKALLDEPYYGGWNDDKLVTVRQAYDINPVASLKDKEDHCIGVQANMWTETTNDIKELEYQLFPRLLSVAETGWLPAEEKDWESFYDRLQRQDEILDAKEVNYARHYILPDAQTEQEKTLATASDILAKSLRGGVGYPDVKTYDALAKAKKRAQRKRAKDNDFNALAQAIADYQKAEVVQPQPGKTYQIRSASTYYKKQFEGASLYQKGEELRIHYTPQNTDDELWTVVAAEGGFYLQNVKSGQQLVLNQLNAPAGLSKQGTLLRMDKATQPSRDIHYVPGAVTLSAAADQEAGKVRRLVAQVSGKVTVADEAALCYPGTWKLVEVKNKNSKK